MQQNRLDQVQKDFKERRQREADLRRNQEERDVERRKLRGDLDEEVRMDIADAEDTDVETKPSPEDTEALRREVRRREDEVEKVRQKTQQRRKWKDRLFPWRRKAAKEENREEVGDEEWFWDDAEEFASIDTDKDFLLDFTED